MHTNPIVYKDVEFLFSMGLNWTFMELKLLIQECSSPHDAFELNLYGIEIRFNVTQNMGVALFELNLYGIEISIVWFWRDKTRRFELNLYGIEIMFNFRKAISLLVWIEPLWNWNLLACEVFLRDPCRLNWTFMELKFFNGNKIFNVLFNVWIEPLWNWNWIFVPVVH